jgi:RHS repeat-associated protein
VDSTFSAQNIWGRLAAVQFSAQYIGTLRYEYSYNTAGRVMTQRLQVPGPSNPFNFDATYAWDNEGRVTSLAYPLSGPTYGYAFDSMGRLSTMKENGLQVAAAGYNWAGQMTALNYDSFAETRTYDPVMMQLTRITTVQGASTVMDMTYKYTAGQNNGRISQSVDGVLNETVNYTYDPLNRLLTAQATNNAWGNSYTYDSFGNLTGMNVIAGSAPHFSTNSDPATNRVVSTPATVYDANGNPIGTQPTGSNPVINQTYDVENRMIWAPGNGGFTYIGYDPSGKRVTQFDMTTGNQLQNERIHFYSITGQRLGTYTLSSSGTYFSATSLNLYFGGKLMRSAGVTVATDRIGSVRGNSNGERMAYWPYGQERTGTPDGREKFGTYFRDAGSYGYTPPDYADQRYYDYGVGRFHTPDPGGRKVTDLRNPTTWNKYIYATDDPVNRADPTGTDDCEVDFCVTVTESDEGGYGGGGGGVTGPHPYRGNDPLSGYPSSGPVSTVPFKVTDLDGVSTRLRQAIADLGSNCAKILPDEATLLADAKELRFVDSQPSANGNLTVAQIAPGLAPYNPSGTLSSIVGSDNAVTLTGSQNTISNTVLLGAQFFLDPITGNNANYEVGQGTVLLHELLHYPTQMGDSSFVSNYGITLQQFESPSSAISRWLKNDCNN